jgi:YHS domain-containing protein
MEEVQPKFVYIWNAKYFPQNVPLYCGVQAGMPRQYYFDTKDKLDKFLKENDDIKYYFSTQKILAVFDGETFYALNEAIKFK